MSCIAAIGADTDQEKIKFLNNNLETPPHAFVPDIVLDKDLSDAINWSCGRTVERASVRFV